MIAILITEKKYMTIDLPDKCSGKYWFLDDELPLGRQRVLGIEANASGDKWIVKETPFVHIYKSETNYFELIKDNIYSLRLGRKAEIKALLITETSSRGTYHYKTFLVRDNIDLNIGRNDNNDIVVKTTYISGNHATLRFENGKWTISDNSNTNGVYVNKRRIIGSVELKPKDVICIVNFKIIIGYNFISINNPFDLVRINTRNIKLLVDKEKESKTEYIPIEREYYYRSPNYKREIVPFELKVDMPSHQEDIEDGSVVLTLAPSMVMGIAALSSGIISAINLLNNGGKIISALPTIIMAIAMLCGMIIFPVYLRKREKKKKILREEDRRRKYIKYLSNIKNEIKINRIEQENILKENYKSVLDCIENKYFWENELWGRTEYNKDFFKIRIGIGNEKMFENIKFPEERFSIDDDYLREELLKLQKAEKTLYDVPICISLNSNKVLGIVGERTGLYNIVNNILSQIVLFHGYDEAKIVCIYEPSEEEQLSYVRACKHIWSNDGKIRFLATNEQEIKELSANLKDIYNTYKEYKSREIIPTQYIILTTSKYLATKCEIISEILSNRDIKGFNIICAYNKKNNLPKECDAIIEVNDKQGLLFEKSLNGLTYGFLQDDISTIQTQNIFRQMSGISLDLSGGKYSLPEVLTFMDMFKVEKIEHLNIRNRWKNNSATKTLQTPVGIGTNGELFYLDLHEKFHGPHGLVAGMTGSGKSEFIITYILSLAINYSPYEVAFVLIDYKGGGLAGAFENEKYKLPHLKGTITNLDSGSVNRSIQSIKSELKRRQIIFNKAREIINEGTIDIYKYQKMFRENLVEEPLPHLFIICDEFAELKSQQPEFLDQLISIARIGRSLGVHLILATQKPSGIVNEQIWANSKFKVCLKVQDKSDSIDMLKKPDASTLVETGRFYLQVGYDELFELGQSAWSGAYYNEEDSMYAVKDESIDLIDSSGNVVDRIRSNNIKADYKSKKQIVAIMEHITRIAKEDNISSKPLWEPELDKHISVDKLFIKYNAEMVTKDKVVALIGEIDNPYEQKKDLMSIDFVKDGNTIIYGLAGSGEDMIINAILYSTYNYYSPEILNTYILDFGSEYFKIYENAPQCGGVVIDGENERIENLFTMIKQELKDRKKILSSYSGDIFEYNKKSDNTLPFIFVIINNFSHFYESYSVYEDSLIAITRESVKYGMYFIITTTSSSGMRYRLQQNFSNTICFKLSDISEYSATIGRTNGVIPNDIVGRGIIKRDEVYVFQTAEIATEKTEQNEIIKEFCIKLSKQYDDKKAKQIPLVPKIVTSDSCENKQVSFDEFTLGISLEDYKDIKINLNENNLLYILSQNNREAGRYALALAEVALEKMNAEIIIVSENSRLDENVSFVHKIVEANDDEKIQEIYNRALRRNNEFIDNGNLPEDDNNPIVIVFNNLSKVLSFTGLESTNKLKKYLEEVRSLCNIYIIISDSHQGSGKYSTDSWYLNRVAGDGVWVGNGCGDQIRLYFNRKGNIYKKNIDDYTGFYISKSNLKFMRLLMQKAELEKENQDG